MRYAALWRTGVAGPPRTHGDIPVAGDRRFGVRAASDVGRCASRGSTAMPLSGTAPCSVINVAIDDALDEQGARNIRPAWGCGDKFFIREEIQ